MRERAFTDEDFDIMVHELTECKPAVFDKLCYIADVTLKNWVRIKCVSSRHKSKLHSDDMMQDIKLRLMQKTAAFFLIKVDGNGKLYVNRDPDGFKSWMFKVAKNLILSKEYNFDITESRDLKPEEEAKAFADYFENSMRRTDEHNAVCELLEAAVQIVLNSASKPYIVLTWLSMCLYILNMDVTKIEANHLIVNNFFHKNLFEIFDITIKASKCIKWLHIGEDLIYKINEKLNERFDDGRIYGEVPYCEFFGRKEPLASISDWENRMNSLIKRVK